VGLESLLLRESGCSFWGSPTFKQSKEDLMPVRDIFPSELRKTLPPLHSQEGIGDPIVYLKFFTYSGWTWYVTEGSPEDDDFIFFGFVIGLEEEWGDFSLSELTEARDPLGRPVQRDLHFEPRRFSRIMARQRRSAGKMELP
jgi:hypothetical protein